MKSVGDRGPDRRVKAMRQLRATIVAEALWMRKRVTRYKVGKARRESSQTLIGPL